MIKIKQHDNYTKLFDRIEHTIPLHLSKNKYLINYILEYVIHYINKHLYSTIFRSLVLLAKYIHTITQKYSNTLCITDLIYKYTRELHSNIHILTVEFLARLFHPQMKRFN